MEHKKTTQGASSNLWLVRHGQTDWNLDGRWQGQAPHAPSLNAYGRAQALALRDQLKDEPFAAVYASDLPRAHQTAELLAEPLELRVALEPRLREIDLGAWEGMLSQDIQARYPRQLLERSLDPLHARAPQGESLMDVIERVLPAVEEIADRHVDESVLLVGHGVSLAVILCWAREIPWASVYDHIPEHVRTYQVEWQTAQTLPVR